MDPPLRGRASLAAQDKQHGAADGDRRALDDEVNLETLLQDGQPIWRVGGEKLYLNIQDK